MASVAAGERKSLEQPWQAMERVDRGRVPGNIDSRV